MSTPNTYKIKISCGNDYVIFEASSPVSESRTVNYQGYEIIHLPTDVWAYKNTSSRKFAIAGKLVSRNAQEALANSHYVDLIRSWALPDFGNSGATPPIVMLSAFNNSNISKVPCILKSYSITYPDDVDWIYEDNNGLLNSPMPVVGMIQVDLDEAYTPKQITQRKWKMNNSGALSPGGSFVYGGAADDVTSTAGGNGSRQATTNYLSGTPSVTDLTGTKDFGGIASASMMPNATVGNSLLTSNTFGAASPGNGNNAGSLNVVSSYSIVPGVTPPVVNSPLYYGFNASTVAQQSAPAAVSLGGTTTVGPSNTTMTVRQPTQR